MKLFCMVVITQEIKDMLKADVPLYDISRRTGIYPSTLHYHYKKMYGLKLKKVNIFNQQRFAL